MSPSPRVGKRFSKIGGGCIQILYLVVLCVSECASLENGCHRMVPRLARVQRGSVCAHRNHTILKGCFRLHRIVPCLRMATSEGLKRWGFWADCWGNRCSRNILGTMQQHSRCGDMQRAANCNELNTSQHTATHSKSSKEET